MSSKQPIVSSADKAKETRDKKPTSAKNKTTNLKKAQDDNEKAVIWSPGDDELTKRMGQLQAEDSDESASSSGTDINPVVSKKEVQFSYVTHER